jgi:hypothetical protein
MSESLDEINAFKKDFSSFRETNEHEIERIEEWYGKVI